MKVLSTMQLPLFCLERFPTSNLTKLEVNLRTFIFKTKVQSCRPDGFRFLLLILFQHGFWSLFWVRSQLSIQNLWIIQQTPDKRNKFDSYEWLLYLLVGRTYWTFRHYQSFYLCNHHGSLLLYEHFLRVTKRDWIGIWDCRLHVWSLCVCIFGGINSKYW